LLPLRISVLKGDVLSFYVAKLTQSQQNCLGTEELKSRVGIRIDTLSGEFRRLLRGDGMHKR
jgi:hypothetical protein